MYRATLEKPTPAVAGVGIFVGKKPPGARELPSAGSLPTNCPSPRLRRGALQESACNFHRFTA